MASRYDYRDPGTDSAYCDGFAATDYAHCQICNDTVLVYDDMPEDEPVVCDRCRALNPDQPDPPVDPAEHAAHGLLVSLENMEIELSKVTELPRAMLIESMLDVARGHLAAIIARADIVLTQCMERPLASSVARDEAEAM